jgi:hypothetical protein
MVLNVVGDIANILFKIAATTACNRSAVPQRSKQLLQAKTQVKSPTSLLSSL